MSKLTKVNNLLFTIMASLLIVTFIVIIVQIIIDMLFNKYQPHDDAIYSNEKSHELVNQNKRSHVISYNKMVLVDSLRSIYIIPITQIELKDFEDLPPPSPISPSRPSVPMALEIMDIDYPYYMGSGIQNNIVIVDMKNETRRILYEKRICIVNYKIFEINDRKILFLIVCRTDTNNDGKLDENDLLELEAYDFLNNSLDKISKNPQHITRLDIVQETKEVILTMGIDKNGDNKFDSNSEPVRLYKVNFSNLSIERLLSTPLTTKLQSILDGTE